MASIVLKHLRNVSVPLVEDGGVSMHRKECKMYGKSKSTNKAKPARRRQQAATAINMKKKGMKPRKRK